MNKKNYRGDIDGLRALAVLPVVFYHLGLGFPGGFVGVDVFFVISGYLISGILLRDIQAGQFSLLEFYDRRVRRILPAFFAMVVAVLVAGWFLMWPSAFDSLGRHLYYVCAFASNHWLAGFDGGYFGPTTEQLPLLHTWSLAVEEQFYFVVPLLLLALCRWQRRHLLLCVLILFGVSLGYGVYTSFYEPKSAFYLLPSRAWQLALGTLICLVAMRASFALRPVIRELICAAGLILISLSYAFISGGDVYPGWAALAPTFGAGLIILAGCGGIGMLGNLIGSRPLRFVGKISYSLYLWHWPVIVFAKLYLETETLSLFAQLTIFVLSVVLSVLSWRFIEQPFRKPRTGAMRHRYVVANGIVVLGIFFCLGLFIRKEDGFDFRLRYFVGDTVYDTARAHEARFKEYKSKQSFNALKQFESGGIQVGAGKSITPQVVVMGDSHATMFGATLVGCAADTPIAFFTEAGKRPFFDKSAQYDDTIKEYLSRWKPQAVVVIMRMDKRQSFWRDSTEQSVLDVWERSIREIAKECDQLYFSLQVPLVLEESVRGKEVFERLVSLTGKLSDSGVNALPSVVEESQLSAISREEMKIWLQSLSVPNLVILDPSEVLLDQRRVRVIEDGLLLYRDDNHLSTFGASLVAPLFRVIFERLDQ